MTLGLGLAGTDDAGEAGEVSTTLGLAVLEGTAEVGSSAVLVVHPATIVPTSSAHAARRQRKARSHIWVPSGERVTSGRTSVGSARAFWRRIGWLVAVTVRARVGTPNRAPKVIGDSLLHCAFTRLGAEGDHGTHIRSAHPQVVVRSGDRVGDRDPGA